MRNGIRISYCIGVYNEERIIEQSLTFLKKNLDKILGFNKYEIIIVDNGSTDQTYNIVKKYNSETIRVFKIPFKGHGAALKKAIEKSRYPYIAITGIDLPFGFDDLRQYLKIYGKFDIVFGSKAHPNSKINTSAKRKIASIIYRYLVLIFFGLKIRDPQGSIFFRNEKVTPILKYCNAVNILFTTQIAIYGQKHGLAMTEIPVTMISQIRKSKYAILEDGSKILKSIIGEYFRYKNSG